MTLRDGRIAVAAFLGGVGLVLFGIIGIALTKDRDREHVVRRSSRVWGRTLTIGGVFLCVLWSLSVVGMLVTFYPSFINQTWPLLGEPSIVRYSVLPIGAGMLAAGSAVPTHRSAWRSFGLGLVLGAVELLLVTYLIVAAFGPMLLRPLTPNIPSRLGVQIFNVWIFLGTSVAIGSVAALVAVIRGRRWRTWGLAGASGVVAVSILLMVIGWMPFEYWELPKPG